MFTGETSNELKAVPTHSVVAGLSPAVRLARSSHTIGVLREHTRVVSDLAHDWGAGGDRDCDGRGSACTVVGVCCLRSA